MVPQVTSFSQPVSQPPTGSQPHTGSPQSQSDEVQETNPISFAEAPVRFVALTPHATAAIRASLLSFIAFSVDIPIQLGRFVSPRFKMDAVRTGSCAPTIREGRSLALNDETNAVHRSFNAHAACRRWHIETFRQSLRNSNQSPREISSELKAIHHVVGRIHRWVSGICPQPVHKTT